MKKLSAISFQPEGGGIADLRFEISDGEGRVGLQPPRQLHNPEHSPVAFRTAWVSLQRETGASGKHSEQSPPISL